VYTRLVTRSAAARWAPWAIGLVALVGLGHLCAAQGGDFRAFYDVGEAALAHGDVYARGPRMSMYVFYAPHFSLLLAPFALFPPYAAAWLWVLLKLAGMAYLFRWVRDACRSAAPGTVPRAELAYAVLPFLVAFNPFMSEFRLGQANLFVLLFSVLTVVELGRGRPLRAALWFSIAAVKITPLALLPWLALRRQWRFLASLVVVGCGWLLALALFWGPSRVPGLFLRWVHVTATVKATLHATAYFENQSLQGAAARLAEHLPALQDPLLGLPAYRWLWILPCAALVGLLALSAARDRFRARLPLEELGLASLLMLLASADSRYAHHVQLLAPLAAVAALAARARLLEGLPRLGPWLAPGRALPAPDGRGLRVATGVLLAAGVVVLVLLGRDVVGPTANRLARALGAGTSYDVALAAFLSVRLLRGARSADPGAGAAAAPPGGTT
jgi:hypothetical protein